jgi:hypothetical protein
MNLRIAGIRRGNLYSPNHIGNDAAIFNLVTEYLRKKGVSITEYSEIEFQESNIEADCIYNMARDKKTWDKLQKLEDEGVKIINSGYGIDNCTRAKMTHLLVDNQIPHPRSIIVPTGEELPKEAEALSSCCWIKRGDFHAIHREDVTFSASHEETQNIINEYALRGIPSAVINEHLKGDLIKFYGVEGSNFFYWFYPNLAHSKFGLEAINGEAKGLAFDLDYLKDLCSKVSMVLNTYIYGGDAIVDADGTIRIIDFNDWPSFAPCREAAAPHIAQCIYDYATK